MSTTTRTAGWLAWIVATFCALVLQLNPANAQESPLQRTDPPNVLFISVDDLRPSLGAYGDTFAVTPNIDQLASESIVFLRAYAQQAICNPSRASVLTGRRPETTRVWANNRHFRDALPNVVTLPQYFEQHGYETRAVGKIYHDPAWAQDSLSWSAPAELAVTLDAGAMYARDHPIKNTFKASATERAEVADSVYIDGKVARRAIDILQEIRGRPFFLAIGFRRPHLPFTAPERYWRLHDRTRFPSSHPPNPPRGAPELAVHEGVELRGYTDMPAKGPLTRDQIQQLWRGYYAATTFVDVQIGYLLDSLDELGLKENTIVVLWSDHGFHLGEQGLWAKTTNFELDTRVPLVIRVPGVQQAGVRSTALVELVDLFPTLAELSGLPIPVGLEGTSMAPLLVGPERPWKSAVFSQAFAHIEESANPNAQPEILGFSARTNRYRYVEWVDMETGSIVDQELYDYAEQAVELVNVADDPAHAELLRDMSRILRKGWREAGPLVGARL